MSVRPISANHDKPGWLARHKQKLRDVENRKDAINLVFIGDSITQAWEDKGKREWKKYFAHYGALNLGYGGDRTEHVLWRIQQGELIGLTPRLVVLLIGTNNTGHHQDPPADTANAIAAIVEHIQKQSPSTSILLHAIMPCGQYADDPLRRINDHINQLIKPLADQQRVHWLDLNHLFVDENGEINASVMNDFLHPNVYQYKRWADNLVPVIDHLMNTENVTERSPPC